MSYLYNRIISFDVGIKNLSICVIDSNDSNVYSIKKWIVIQLKGKNISDYTKDLIEKLRNEHFGVIDYCLIEQQVNRNTQMKVLSHVIQTFFMCDYKLSSEKIIFVSPKIRFSSSPNDAYNTLVQLIKLSHGWGDKLSRKEYKQLSVEVTTELLIDKPEWKEWFNSNGKKDDLADSLLQAHAWTLNKNISSNMDIDTDWITFI